MFILRKTIKLVRNDLAKRLSLISQQTIRSIVCRVLFLLPLEIHPSTTVTTDVVIVQMDLVHIQALVGPAQRSVTLHFLSIYVLLIIPKRRKESTSSLSHYKRHSNFWIHKGKQHYYYAEELLINQ